MPLSLLTHPSMLLYFTHNSYCSFAVKTQVPEPLKQNMTFTVLRSENQNVHGLLCDIHILYIVHNRAVDVETKIVRIHRLA